MTSAQYAEYRDTEKQSQGDTSIDFFIGSLKVSSADPGTQHEEGQQQGCVQYRNQRDQTGCHHQRQDDDQGNRKITGKFARLVAELSRLDSR